jgi:hypothetical protein
MGLLASSAVEMAEMTDAATSGIGDGSNRLPSSPSVSRLVRDIVNSRSDSSASASGRAWKAAWTAGSSLARPGRKALAHTILVPYAAFPMIVRMPVRLGVKVWGDDGKRRMSEQVMEPV